MKLISIFVLCLLTSCNAFVKHKDDLKPMARDMVDEAIDDAAEELQEPPVEQPVPKE